MKARRAGRHDLVRDVVRGIGGARGGGIDVDHVDLRCAGVGDRSRSRISAAAHAAEDDAACGDVDGVADVEGAGRELHDAAESTGIEGLRGHGIYGGLDRGKGISSARSWRHRHNAIGRHDIGIHGKRDAAAAIAGFREIEDAVAGIVHSVQDASRLSHLNPRSVSGECRRSTSCGDRQHNRRPADPAGATNRLAHYCPLSRPAGRCRGSGRRRFTRWARPCSWETYPQF